MVGNSSLFNSSFLKYRERYNGFHVCRRNNTEMAEYCEF